MTEMIRLKITTRTASGHSRGWFKLVTAVDQTKKNGYAFAGAFLRDDTHALPLDGIVVEQYPTGSVKNGADKGDAYRVTADGLSEAFAHTADWHRDFLDFRDAVAAALHGGETASTPASHVAVLLDERAALLARVAKIDMLLATG